MAVSLPVASAAECRVCGSVALEVFFPPSFFLLQHTDTQSHITRYVTIYIKKKVNPATLQGAAASIASCRDLQVVFIKDREHKDVFAKPNHFKHTQHLK